MKKVIYVEDEADKAEAVKGILEIEGYHVDLAFCGNDGLDMIKKKKYDLALLDIMLPDMSGWELFQKIKNKKMKFVFLSALPISGERFKELKKSGISDYITKPFTKKSLTVQIMKIIG